MSEKWLPLFFTQKMALNMFWTEPPSDIHIRIIALCSCLLEYHGNHWNATLWSAKESFFQSVPVCQLKTGRIHEGHKDAGWNNKQDRDICFDKYREHMKPEEQAIYSLIPNYTQQKCWGLFKIFIIKTCPWRLKKNKMKDKLISPDFKIRTWTLPCFIF